MAQQTAVEWFADKMYDVISDRLRLYLEAIKREAKAMEKEQIMKAYDDGAIDTMQEEEGLDISIHQIGEESEKYYNETYKTSNHDND